MCQKLNDSAKLLLMMEKYARKNIKHSIASPCFFFEIYFSKNPSLFFSPTILDMTLYIAFLLIGLRLLYVCPRLELMDI